MHERLADRLFFFPSRLLRFLSNLICRFYRPVFPVRFPSIYRRSTRVPRSNPGSFFREPSQFSHRSISPGNDASKRGAHLRIRIVYSAGFYMLLYTLAYSRGWYIQDESTALAAASPAVPSRRMRLNYESAFARHFYGVF